MRKNAVIPARIRSFESSLVILYVYLIDLKQCIRTARAHIEHTAIDDKLMVNVFISHADSTFQGHITVFPLLEMFDMVKTKDEGCSMLESAGNVGV